MVLSYLVALAMTQSADSAVESHALKFESRVLRGNPLKDPTERRIAIFRPSGSTTKKPPLVFYLPGFGGSSDDCLANPQTWIRVVSDLRAKGVDVVLAVVDGRNRFGCSQYINSPASGRYLDYLCDEVLPFVEKQENCGGSAPSRLVVGHSSGGFGALRLGMARQATFGGVVALSPDSNFDVTHKGFTLDAAVAKLSPEKVRTVEAPTFAPLSSLGDEAGYPVALCADYAGDKDGKFEWLYDKDGAYRPEVYERWREQDPAVIAERLAHPFSPSQRVYLDGAAQDEFKANLGAAKVFEVLNAKHVTVTVDYPLGHHSDHLGERIVRGVSWVLGLPLR